MTAGSVLTLALWQDETPQGGIDACLRVIGDALHEAAAAHVDVLVFPECFLTGYYRDPSEVAAVANSVAAHHVQHLQGMAQSTGVGFVLGAYEAVEAGIANAAHVFLPGREAPLTYRKRALFGDWEKSVFVPGTGPLLFEYKSHCFAVLICFDVEFPELVRHAALMGADTVLVPTALMAPEDDAADFLVPARAIENNVTIVYANRIGREEPLEFIGKSQICGPRSATRSFVDRNHRGLLVSRVQAPPMPFDYLTEFRALVESQPKGSFGDVAKKR